MTVCSYAHRNMDPKAPTKPRAPWFHVSSSGGGVKCSLEALASSCRWRECITASFRWRCRTLAAVHTGSDAAVSGHSAHRTCKHYK